MSTFPRSGATKPSVATVPISNSASLSVALLFAATSDRLRVRDPIATNGSFKADSHIACRAHALPVPCRAAKGFECVLPIWFTQCGRVWFTLAMPCSDHAVLLKATAQHGRREKACGLPARVRLLPATTRSYTKIVIRSIPILLTTIHTYDCKEW